LTVYRVTQPGHDQAVDVDAIGAIEGVIRAGKPGRYPIDEMSRDPFPVVIRAGAGASGSSTPMEPSSSSPTGGQSDDRPRST
jgi:hypothetical protein